jgi:hypothetical protein
MEQQIEFALTIAKSKDGNEWNTVSVGHWAPPEAPKLDGEILPDPILDRLKAMDLKGFGEGGTHNLKYGEWYYRFDLVKKETGSRAL